MDANANNLQTIATDFGRRLTTIEKDVAVIQTDLAAVKKQVGGIEADVVVIKRELITLDKDVAVIKSNYATRADVSDARVSIIMWVTSAIFLAQLLPALLKKFGL